MRCIASREGDLDAALRKGGGGVPRAASTAALPAETVVVAAPGPQRGAKAGPRGGTRMATDGLSTPGATTPREAGGGSGERLGTLLGMQNGTSCPPQGGASIARGQAGISPGNATPQGADPGAGPAAPGARLGGSAHGPTAADRGGGAGIPTVRAELQGPNGMSQPPQGGADRGAGPAALGAEHSGSSNGGGIGPRAELEAPNGKSQLILEEESAVSGDAMTPPGNGVQQGADPGAGPAAVPGAGPGSTSYQEGKCSARPRPTPAGAAQRAQGHRRPSRWWLCGC